MKYTRRRTISTLNGAALLAILATVLGLTVQGSAPRASAALQPFASSSPFRTPIPDGAAVDPNSEAMVASATRSGGMSANLVAYGIPVYYADASTTRFAVECTVKTWGPCPIEGREVPIPDDAQPNTGSDAAMVVVDESTREIFEFWRARHADDRWTTSFGTVGNLDGSGWGDGATASGASRLGGVIRVGEVQAGVIPHALALQSANTCVDIFRSPATNTDGQSSAADCLPEGARLRLDPTVDLNTLSLTSAARMVAQALQTYGAYVIDSGGAPLSVSFELDPTAANGSTGATYKGAGLRWDYDNMPGVPWDRLQVLA